jgi:fatty acid desaturase
VYLVGPLVRYALFPLGGDYHLPHHLFQLVPHYRLTELHQLLLEVREYREQACIVEGYFRHRRPPRHPTVVELIAQASGRAP